MTDDSKICPYCAETIKLAATKCRYCKSDLPGARASSLTSGSDVLSPMPAESRPKHRSSAGLWPAHATAVPLLDWKGFKHMTRRPLVVACCRSCGNEWQIESKFTNTLAQELGLGGRLTRRGTRVEQFGATFTVGASGRRIAAGNEKERQEQALAQLMACHSCTTCGAIDILLAKE